MKRSRRNFNLTAELLSEALCENGSLEYGIPCATLSDSNSNNFSRRPV
jgi:hypothetical protein